MRNTLLASLLLLNSFLFITNAQSLYRSAYFSRWSLQLKGGFDHVNIAPMGISFKDHASWLTGFSIEKTMSPLVGYGFNIDYFRYDRSNVNGSVIDPYMHASVNLSNLLQPSRFNNILNFYANVGVGTSMNTFKNAIFAPDTVGISGFDYAYPLLLASSINAEFNLSSVIALGLEAVYHRSYSFQGLLHHRSIYAIHAGLRFKFNASNGKHLRNIVFN